MISLNDIARALNGVWLLFLDRPGAIRLFDASTEGFWRSFQAIVLVAPVYAVVVLANNEAYAIYAAQNGQTHDAGAFMTARAVGLVLDWVAVPVLLAVLAPFLGIGRGYAAYIVARNWSAVLTTVPTALVALLAVSGLVDGNAILVPAGLALAIALRVGYLAARRALNVPIDAAIGYVALDVLMGLLIASLVEIAFGIGA
jgi:hypothetical protein